MERTVSGRTEEQKAADAGLDEAIKRALLAYEADPEYLLIDYIVLTAETRFDDKGQQYTAYTRLYRDGDMPWYRILGLLDMHRTLAHSLCTSGDDNG